MVFRSPSQPTVQAEAAYAEQQDREDRWSCRSTGDNPSTWVFKPLCLRWHPGRFPVYCPLIGGCLYVHQACSGLLAPGFFSPQKFKGIGACWELIMKGCLAWSDSSKLCLLWKCQLCIFNSLPLCSVEAVWPDGVSMSSALSGPHGATAHPGSEGPQGGGEGPTAEAHPSSPSTGLWTTVVARGSWVWVGGLFFLSFFLIISS